MRKAAKRRGDNASFFHDFLPRSGALAHDCPTSPGELPDFVHSKAAARLIERHHSQRCFR